MTEAAIEVSGLRKAFPGVQAVAGVDLSIRTGTIFALLGPNGAGKTTTVEILEGYQQRDSGEVSVLGFDPARNQLEMKRRIGIVSQETAADSFLTVREIMAMIAGAYPAPRNVDEVIALVGLSDKAGTRVGKLSGGQKRRLDVGLAIVGNPDLCFLDEPTTGFDPDARQEAWAMIRELKDMGKTVLLTTHYMDEAQNLADEVAVIAVGRIIATGTPETLGGRAEAASTISFRLPAGTDLPDRFAAEARMTRRGAMQIIADDPVPLLNDLTGWAMAESVSLTDLTVERPTLEEIYLSLIANDTAERKEGA
ncbi:ABC transporter ATP-binding protein [Parvularcula flava]|uniref:ABC transporter n=1 Tax=Aquisalinus luteolus TaxID=1566827 RepID=A0A8J3A226_9PROT|nr:ABC transporter ATP-binding protein [Aquisalinus luteolus]NHK28029.1 ABC transporter ATP-binding protein [Aquisalinus luteolus]GGH97250.1 ABC transporter [Aquisalinus luteolus]